MAATVTSTKYHEDMPERPRSGDCGKELACIVNSVPIRLLVDYINVYDLIFEPEVPSDAGAQRKALLDVIKDQLTKTYGTWFNDNTRLWAIRQVPGNCEFATKDRRIVIRHIKQIDMSEGTAEEQEMIIHVILKKCIDATQLMRIGRNYFEKDLSIEEASNELKSDRYERMVFWKGFSLAVEPSVSGLMLKTDISHRILHYRNVRDQMNDIARAVDSSPRFRSETEKAAEVIRRVAEMLKGAAVLTLYNKRVWRVHDIDWDLSVTDKFTMDDDDTREQSYQQYFFQRYGAITNDTGVGMLIHEPRKKSGESETKRMVLPPELCYMTGLTKKMKADYHYMRSVADKTRLKGNIRHRQGVAICEKLADTIKRENGTMRHDDSSTESKQSHSEGRSPQAEVLPIPLKLTPQAIDFKARILDPVQVVIPRSRNGESKTIKSKSELQLQWTKSSFFKPDSGEVEKVRRWAVLCETKDNAARDFLKELKPIAKEQSVWGSYLKDAPEIHIVKIKNESDHAASWKKYLKKYIERDELQMVVCIIPSGRHNIDIYTAVKSEALATQSIICQCLQEKSLRNRSRVRSIIRNLLKQIMTKAGYIPWKVKWDLPDGSMNFNKPSMMVGIDVNHDWKRSRSSVGFVASYDQDFVQYNSFVTFQERGQEILTLVKDLMKKALKRFYREWGFLPRQIVVFRDGVSNSQLKQVQDTEVRQMQQAFAEVVEYCKKKAPGQKFKKPKLLMIIVQKRVTARFLTQDEQSVPPGTVVDHTVVSERMWDFYMVSCEPPRQGTATPSRYIVVHDEVGISQNDVQSLVHQMCSLYFNWPGPVRTPAPCMYASKIGYLFGTALMKKEPDAHMTKMPYYL